MRVRDVMAKMPKSCASGMNLAQAADLMWTGRCGALPVVDDEGDVIGILTDRDICLRVATRDCRPSEMTAGEAMTRRVAVCHPDDDIHSALKTMRSRKVRRLPVVSSEGRLVGMLSVSELLPHARHIDGSRPELSHQDIVSTLIGIWVHGPPHAECA